jgi:hypothetical protein
MSLTLAITEMMGHLDTLVNSLPEPSGGRRRLPEDFVVLRSVAKKVSGIGRVSQESAVENIVEHSGALTANIDVQLWGPDGTDVIARSRELITNLLNLQNQKTAHGVFVKTQISTAQGPDYSAHVRGWRLSVGLSVDFEYSFVEAPGVGVIQQISVDMEDDIEEDFIITSS